MDSGTRSTPARGVRTALRLAGTAIAALVALGLTPAVADAAAPSQQRADRGRARRPRTPSPTASSSSPASWPAAQPKVDDAHAASAIALDDYQSTQAAYEDGAAARRRPPRPPPRRPPPTSGWPAGDVVAFARRSYMQGSTYSGAAALITAGGPG